MGLKNERSYVAKIERLAHGKSQTIWGVHQFELNRSAAQWTVADSSFQGVSDIASGCDHRSSETMRGHLY